MNPAPLSFLLAGTRMARLSRRHKNTIINVINKWRDAFAGINPVNHDRIRELIKVAYSTKTKQVRSKTKRNHWQRKTVKLGMPTVHFLRSPIAFDIAQAVCRGRLGKKSAETICANYGIDASFVPALRRDYMTHSFGQHHYYRGSSALNDVWKATLEDHVNGAQSAAFLPPPEATSLRDREEHKFYKRFESVFPDMPGLSRDQKVRNIQNNDRTLTNGQYKAIGTHNVQVMRAFSCKTVDHDLTQKLLDVPWSSNADSATLDRVSLANVSRWGNNYIDAEIICAMLDVKDVKQTWPYELMREAHVVMFFNDQVLVLAERPTVLLNANGELHNDEGPAVFWADGAKQYYIDGHELGHLGEKIVEHPEQLTLTHINTEENEEIKRLAIEKFGWGRYLEGVGATVIDRRENAVDNTIEALVSVCTTAYRRIWNRQPAEEITIEQRKLILSCRSTARQYFLAVPEDTRDCEEGQRWMASGANTHHVAALQHPVRIIGAS